jgi:hypothetical protein
MTYVTMGGVTIGICILVATIFKWFPGVKAFKKDPLKHAANLLPFLLSWTFGCLTVLGIGGLIGWTARTARWITNWLGDAALVWGVGGDWDKNASAATYLPLTQAGGGIVLIMATAMIVAIKTSRYSNDLKMGLWCGICLGTSAGIAGFAAVPLAIAVNNIGNVVYGVFR